MINAGNVFIRHIGNKTIVCGIFPKLNLEGEKLYYADILENAENERMTIIESSKCDVPEAKGNTISGLLQAPIWRTFEGQRKGARKEMNWYAVDAVEEECSNNIDCKTCKIAIDPPCICISCRKNRMCEMKPAFCCGGYVAI